MGVRWLRGAVGGLPGVYWFLWAGLLINRVGGFAVLYLSLYLTAERGAGAALAGLVVGTYGIGGVIGTLAGGVLTDRWGRRSTLIWSHLACAAVLVGLAVSTPLPLIAGLCLLLGLTQAMPGPAFVAAITDAVPADHRLRAFNLQFWAFNLGTAGASLLAGALARWSYLGLFLLDAASTLITALIIAWKVPETLTRAGRSAPSTGGMRTVFADRIFLVFVGLTLLQALLTSQTNTIVPLAMHDDGLGPGGYGLVTALGGALIVVGQLFVPGFIDRRRKDRVLALSMAVMAAGFAVLAVADSLPVYLVAAVIWTVGGMIAAPPNAAINSELAPALLRGRYQAVFFLSFPAASFVAPALGGAGLEFFGAGHWVIVAAVGLLAAGLHLAAGPARERRVAALESTADQHRENTSDRSAQ
ncbi:MFS family permease [Actinoplanes octamycinicus]|uniref:MFS family permease n=1 Tax=Actinoplanes octamycinicus TaxID=135948 RepID=A0A7W7M5D8_9ACTN|nr:MFS transporter [Actinoplanes octamycinicus]MBB4737614.1 MFS family permease [Actinoplanes octamycinicus]GIE57918.1 MFS transporter [Actinoplanes octamycinicus]